MIESLLNHYESNNMPTKRTEEILRNLMELQESGRPISTFPGTFNDYLIQQPSTPSTRTSSGIFDNTKQENIKITSDRVELILRDHMDVLKVRYSFWTPVWIWVSILTTLLTADFKNTSILSSDSWKSLFLALLFVCFIWFVYNCVIVAIKWWKWDIKKILDEVKNGREFK